MSDEEKLKRIKELAKEVEVMPIDIKSTTKTVILDINSILSHLKDKDAKEIVSYYKDVFGVNVVLIDCSKSNLSGSNSPKIPMVI